VDPRLHYLRRSQRPWRRAVVHGGRRRDPARHRDPDHLFHQRDSDLWSLDNRTAGFRLCGAGSKAIRIECRIGGADLNPYLAFAALTAAGLAGIEQKLELEAPFVGDAYQGKALAEVPTTLREATDLMRTSKMLRAAFGDDVIDHYVHTANWEQFEYDRRITDWELKRGFERY
jgi:glutamine synthetase